MANPARQAVDKFGTVHFVDDNSSFAERAMREVQLVGQATCLGMMDHADAVTKEFMDSSPNKLFAFCASSWAATAILKKYQVAGNVIANLGGLAYSAATAGEMARDTKRWNTIKQAMDDTWLNGKNLEHSLKMSEKEFARTTLDVAATGVGVVPVTMAGIGRLSFLKRCKVDPSGCTKAADDLFAAGNLGKATATLEEVLKFTQKREPNNLLAIGELNGKLARCKFKQVEQFKEMNRVEQLVHPTEKLELAAVKHHNDAMAAFKSATSEKMDVTDTLIEMGGWYKNEKRFAEAHEAYAAALDIRSKSIPKQDQLPIATIWEHMGDLRHAEKKHDLADECYAKMIKIVEDKRGLSDGSLVLPLERRGGYAYQNGNFQGAQEFMTRALELKRSRYPLGDPRVGEHIPCLADVLRACGKEDDIRRAHDLYWEAAIQGGSYMYDETQRKRIAGGLTACAKSLQEITEQRLAIAGSAAEAAGLQRELKLLQSQAKGIPWLAFGEKSEVVELVRNLTPKQSFNL